MKTQSFLNNIFAIFITCKGRENTCEGHEKFIKAMRSCQGREKFVNVVTMLVSCQGRDFPCQGNESACEEKFFLHP